MNSVASPAKSAALQRCLNSPYLRVDESRRAEVRNELAMADEFYEKAVLSFQEEDEATGLKQAWAAMFRAARALVYKAGYDVDQLRCMEIVLRVYYAEIGADEIDQLRRAQELVGTPEEALARAKTFMAKVATLA